MIYNEIKRRFDLWNKIKVIEDGTITPTQLREMRVYGGSQGIYTDKLNTSDFTENGNGLTVSILHLGDYYPDEVDENGILYHYPATQRSPSRDEGEVLATKNCIDLRVPIFVIMPGNEENLRKVRLGWVMDFDDENKLFLISFSEEKPDLTTEVNKNEKFQLDDHLETRTQITNRVRRNQHKFRFNVLKNYGSKCAFCSIAHPKILHAAHIKPKKNKGSDDWRNGIVLCHNHHTAFDENLILIKPDTDLSLEVKADNLNVEFEKVTLSKNQPHIDAISWRYDNIGKVSK